MRYTGNRRIKALIAAGILTLGLAGCKREIKGYTSTTQGTTISGDVENNTGVDASIDNSEKRFAGIEEFKESLQEDFSKSSVTLDEESDEFVSSIIIDGTNVSIELTDGSIVSGTLYKLEMSDITFENFYVYDSQYIDDLYNREEKYSNYRENGNTSALGALYDDYRNHEKLYLETKRCSVNNEYKIGIMQDVGWYFKIDYSNCRKVWLENFQLEEDSFSDMPNLETLVLVDTLLASLDEEDITIQSNSLKNIIIDGKDSFHSIDYFDFTGCPNLEVVSIPNNSQETNLDGLKGLKNLKKVAFGLPNNTKYNLSEGVLKDFQDRIDLVSKTLSTDDQSLAYSVNSFISDISGINGSAIETLNISFLKRVSSESLLETVKSLPNLKQIVGFEINNAGMCSDELIEYCENHEIEHPFTEKSLEIKHKLQEIVSSQITEDMSDEEKIKALSKYIATNMEYDYDLIEHENETPEELRKGWGESLYYSVIEGKGVCEGYAMYAQNLFTEAGIISYKIEGLAHTWNLVQIEDGYYYVDLTGVDVVMGKEETLSEDEYNELMGCYYLVPVEDESKFHAFELPIEAEKRADAAEAEREAKESDRIEGIEVGQYMLQANREEINKRDYTSLCGIIGILCALGLAKKVGSKQETMQKDEMSAQNSSPENRIKTSSLKEAITKLKRFQKLEELKSKRDIADSERTKNKKAKQLEREAFQTRKEEETK